MLTRKTATLLAFVLLAAHGHSGRAETPTPAAAATAAPVVPHAAHADSIDRLPVAVDGAKNPEKIPADLAYRHFIRAIAGPEKDAPADLSARRRAHLSQIGLAGADEAALLSSLRGVAEELRRVEVSRRSASADPSSATSELDALRVQERELLDTARERIGSSLSVEGAGRLDAHVQEHVRKRIVIYGVLPQ